MSKYIEVIAVLDNSGSMRSTHSESVSEFNRYVADLNSTGVKAKITLYFFNSVITKAMDRVKIKNFKPVDASEHQVSGMTALYDGIGTAIRDAKQGKPAVLMIMTDGGENSSKTYNASMVKEMITKCEANEWEILFFGADLDAATASQGMGMKASSLYNIAKSADGYATRSAATMGATMALSEKNKVKLDDK